MTDFPKGWLAPIDLNELERDIERGIATPDDRNWAETWNAS